jgi:epoxyqueuosine reductase
MLIWAVYRRLFRGIETREARLARRNAVVRAASDSPLRVEFGSRPFLAGKGLRYRLAYRFRILPKLLRAGREARRGFALLRRTPAGPPSTAPAELFPELEELARELGVDEVGYARLEPSILFRGKAVLYPQAIVLLRHMEAEPLSRAPSFETLAMIHETYLELGRATNRLAEELLRRGYGAQPDPALGGTAVFPVLAARAGLGALGRHGLLISARFGCRQRLSAVYTSITNLPGATGAAVSPAAEYAWVREFCDGCEVCVNVCPGQAILREPVELANGGLRHIDADRCLSQFYGLDGCSWCIKECPFNRVPYGVLKEDFLRGRRLRLYDSGGSGAAGCRATSPAQGARRIR